MSQASDHVILSKENLPGVIAPYYFCLEGEGVNPGPAPGRTWQLRDSAGKEVVLQSRLPTEDQIVVRTEAAGEEPTEHAISRVFDADGLHLTLQSSVLMGTRVDWDGGLALPTGWFLKQAVSATSSKPYDSLNGHLQMSVKLKSFAGDKFKLPEWSPLPKKEVSPGNFVLDNFNDEDVIVLAQEIKSLKTGAPIVDINMYFAHSFGCARVSGRIVERSIRYHLAKILP